MTNDPKKLVAETILRLTQLCDHDCLSKDGTVETDRLKSAVLGPLRALEYELDRREGEAVSNLTQAFTDLTATAKGLVDNLGDASDHARSVADTMKEISEITRTE